MANKLYNLIRLTTPTVGTGTLTLVSTIGNFLTFALAGATNGDVVDYCILDGSNSEVGFGTYNSAGPTLTRTVTKSTNANALVSLSGSAQVGIWPRAETLADASRFTTGNIPVAQLALFLASQNAFTAQQTMTPGTLTASSAIAWNVAAAQKAKITLGATNTFSAVTGAVEGTTYTLVLIQDSTGARTVTWTTTGTGSFDFGALGAPTLTTTLNKSDLVSFEAVSIAGTLKLRYCGIQKGFS